MSWLKRQWDKLVHFLGFGGSDNNLTSYEQFAQSNPHLAYGGAAAPMAPQMQAAMAPPQQQPLPEGVPPYEEFKAQLLNDLAQMQQLVEQAVSVEQKQAEYAIKGSADLNGDGTLSGKDETKAILEKFLESDASEAAMLKSAFEFLCTNGVDGKVSNEQTQQLNEALNYVVGKIAGNNDYIKAEKALAQAIESGQDAAPYKEALMQQHLQLVMESIQEDPMLDMIQQLPYPQQQVVELAQIYAQGFTQIQLQGAARTMELIEQHPELRKAVLEQPEIGELSKVSWVDFCKERDAQQQQQHGCGCP